MIAAAFLIAAGAICVALFVHLNLNVQPRWFPHEVATRDGMITPTAAPPITHLVYGLLVATLFFVGVALFALGSAVVATTIGYGHA